jgi:hypothetical protein
MRCGTAQEWLRMRADEPRSAVDQRRLAAHTAACERCAGYGRDMEQLAQLIAGAPCEQPSASFDWRLKLQLAKAERGELLDVAVPGPARWRAGLQFGAAMAAAAGLVVFVGTATLRQRNVQKPASTAATGLAAWNVPAANGGVVTPVRDSGPVQGPAENNFVTRVPYAPYTYFIPGAQQSIAIPDSAPATQGAPVLVH